MSIQVRYYNATTIRGKDGVEEVVEGVEGPLNRCYICNGESKLTFVFHVEDYRSFNRLQYHHTFNVIINVHLPLDS